MERESKIVVNRAIEMGMDEDCIFQNVQDKLSKLEELKNKFNLNLEEIAYIGDDENDLECMRFCGFMGCPNNAMDIIKSECNFISKNKSGEGAVRDFIEYIIENNN